MPTFRRTRRAVLAGTTAAAFLLLTSCTGAKSPTVNASHVSTVNSPSAKGTQATRTNTEDVVNAALGRAADAIAAHVAGQCDKGPEACHKVLAEVNDDFPMTWGSDDAPVTFFEDGSWSIEDRARPAQSGTPATH
ncbi:hypothetical protein ACFV98_02545 [Streptomyces violascens]|uniref:hypothetical protein n=1 Tax=Streptomyces violascens TaxID=67381 RepID=UPI00365E5CED